MRRYMHAVACPNEYGGVSLALLAADILLMLPVLLPKPVPFLCDISGGMAWHAHSSQEASESDVEKWGTLGGMRHVANEWVRSQPCRRKVLTKPTAAYLRCVQHDGCPNAAPAESQVPSSM